MTVKNSAYPIRSNGFTMVEMVIVIASAAMLTLGVGVLLANSQSNWNHLVTRVYGDETVDGFAVQAVFDNVCRKSSTRKYVLGDDSDSLEQYYWDAGSTSSTPENYALIYKSNDQVFVEYGTLQSGTWQKDTLAPTRTRMIADDVNSLKFVVLGTSVQMYLTYSDPDALPVICSSVRNND